MKILYVLPIILLIGCKSTTKLVKDEVVDVTISTDTLSNKLLNTTKVFNIQEIDIEADEYSITEVVYDTITVSGKILSIPKSSKTTSKVLLKNKGTVISNIDNTLTKQEEKGTTVITDNTTVSTKESSKANSILRDKILLWIVGFALGYILVSRYFPIIITIIKRALR